MMGEGTQNAGRRILEGVTATAETVRDLSSGPAMAMSAWIADKVAPSYWVPNSEIIVSLSLLQSVLEPLVICAVSCAALVLLLDYWCLPRVLRSQFV